MYATSGIAFNRKHQVKVRPVLNLTCALSYSACSDMPSASASHCQLSRNCHKPLTTITFDHRYQSPRWTPKTTISPVFIARFGPQYHCMLLRNSNSVGFCCVGFVFVARVCRDIVTKEFPKGKRTYQAGDEFAPNSSKSSSLIGMG